MSTKVTFAQDSASQNDEPIPATGWSAFPSPMWQRLALTDEYALRELLRLANTRSPQAWAVPPGEEPVKPEEPPAVTPIEDPEPWQGSPETSPPQETPAPETPGKEPSAPTKQPAQASGLKAA